MVKMEKKLIVGRKKIFKNGKEIAHEPQLTE